MVPVEVNVGYLVIDGQECNCAFVRDITERKQLEAKLRESERLTLVGQLVLGVAHEVRNPLNGIMIVTDALYEDLGRDPAYKTYVEHIRAQVNRLADLVRDLLDMGKPINPAAYAAGFPLGNLRRRGGVVERYGGRESQEYRICLRGKGRRSSDYGGQRPASAGLCQPAG